MKFLAGILIGGGISWIGMLIALEYYILKDTEKDDAILELLEENNKIKSELDWWHERANSD